MRNCIRTLWRASALSLLMFSAASAQQSTLEFNAKESDGFSLESKALYPEGLEYDAKSERFLLGSIRRGEVIALNKDGTTTRLVDDERLRSVVGIRVDAERGRLLVNSSDYGVATRSTPTEKFASVALGIYDLATGAPLKFVDLSDLRPTEKKFANDLTVDADGNAYITDSLAASIYKVTPSGKASVFLSHDRFRGEGFNLNGIQYLSVVK
ncbi:SMP-30/Gluconolaconase/LRE-like region [Pseudovibrio sp. W64]|nr:SMP-30/Gluconolaconase/LRE-like region [Pseudovibrio sp. W64]